MTTEAARSKAATWVVVAVTAGFAALSIRQIWIRALPELPYAGMPAMSAPWAEPPEDDAAEWRASEGKVPPPPSTASRQDLLLWLQKHYPVLTLDLPANATEGDERRLDLGGGPPRRLYVEPGRGLVGREP